MVAIVLALAAAVGLLGIGIALSSTFGASQVARNATQLHWTNATLGTSGIARASVAQALFFAFDERLGVSSTDAKEAAIVEAMANLDAVESLLTSPDRPIGSPVLAALGEFVDVGRSILSEADTGSPDLAEEQRLGNFEPAFASVQEVLKARQAELSEAIAESQAAGGRIARITQVAITFVIPAVTMVVFWLLLKRRMKMREVELSARIEAERQLGVAKDQFIAGLSHELRTPLTTIYGFSEVLLEDRRLEPDAKEMVGIINAGSAELTRMVNDLITAARIDDGTLSWKPELIDLSNAVDSIVGPYRRAGESIEIHLPAVEVYADPVHVRQIVHNLVSNALRHGGERVVISARTSGAKATLVIADDGPGMPEELASAMFKRFVHRGKEALIAGSLGLGLAVSRELAMRMGGSLAYNRVRNWTTFTVSLPFYGAVSVTASNQAVESIQVTVP